MRLKLQDGSFISEQQYGRNFVYAYSYGDCIVICNNWLFKDQIADLEVQGSIENQFTLKDSLHGREILAACSFRVGPSN